MQDSIQKNATKKEKFNLKRKLWHSLGLIIPILLYIDIFRFVDPKNPDITRYIGMWLILIFLIFLLLIELIRLNYKPFNQFFIQKVGNLMKESEYNRIHGSVSYIFANFLLFLFFTKEVIAISSLVLMVSDPVAAYFGIYYGKRKFPNGKTVEGFIAFAISSFLVSMTFLFFITFFQIGNSHFFLKEERFLILSFIMLITAFVCAIIEMFSFTTLFGLIDDNLTIPISSAVIISIMGYMFHIPVSAYFSPLI